MGPSSWVVLVAALERKSQTLNFLEGSWFWRIWQSGRFWHQRSAVWIPGSSMKYLPYLSIAIQKRWKLRNRGRDWLAHWKTKVFLNEFPYRTSLTAPVGNLFGLKYRQKFLFPPIFSRNICSCFLALVGNFRISGKRFESLKVFVRCGKSDNFEEVLNIGNEISYGPQRLNLLIEQPRAKHSTAGMFRLIL